MTGKLPYYILNMQFHLPNPSSKDVDKENQELTQAALLSLARGNKPVEAFITQSYQSLSVSPPRSLPSVDIVSLLDFYIAVIETGGDKFTEIIDQIRAIKEQIKPSEEARSSFFGKLRNTVKRANHTMRLESLQEYLDRDNGVQGIRDRIDIDDINKVFDGDNAHKNPDNIATLIKVQALYNFLPHIIRTSGEGMNLHFNRDSSYAQFTKAFSKILGEKIRDLHPTSPRRVNAGSREEGENVNDPVAPIPPAIYRPSRPDGEPTGRPKVASSTVNYNESKCSPSEKDILTTSEESKSLHKIDQISAKQALSRMPDVRSAELDKAVYTAYVEEGVGVKKGLGSGIQEPFGRSATSAQRPSQEREGELTLPIKSRSKGFTGTNGGSTLTPIQESGGGSDGAQVDSPFRRSATRVKRQTEKTELGALMLPDETMQSRPSTDLSTSKTQDGSPNGMGQAMRRIPTPVPSPSPSSKGLQEGQDNSPASARGLNCDVQEGEPKTDFNHYHSKLSFHTGRKRVSTSHIPLPAIAESSERMSSVQKPGTPRRGGSKGDLLSLPKERLVDRDSDGDKVVTGDTRENLQLENLPIKEPTDLSPLLDCGVDITEKKSTRESPIPGKILIELNLPYLK